MLDVSIVLATYNGELYLQEQLDSLVAQSRLPDHLLVSDDGSTDSTWDIVTSFAASAPFPVELTRRTERLGAQQNFGQAIQDVAGDVMFFCDQDDRWHSDKIASAMALFESNERLGLVLNDASLTDAELRPIGRTLFEQHHLDEHDLEMMRTGRAFWVFAKKMPPYGSTLALRLDVAKACLPLPEGQTYDQWIGQLASLTAEVAVIGRPLQDYRQHSAQVTGIHEGSKLRQILERRQTHNRGELDRDIRRLEQLQQRLPELDQNSKAVAEATSLTAGRLTLEKQRQRVRAQVLARPISIASLLISGAYHRHARGFRSAALDLLAER